MKNANHSAKKMEQLAKELQKVSEGMLKMQQERMREIDSPAQNNRLAKKSGIFGMVGNDFPGMPCQTLFGFK